MTYAVFPLLVAALCIALGPRILTALIIIAYLAVEGFFKLMSNYHPAVHVGADIIVLTFSGWLVIKAVLTRRAGIPDLPWVRLIILYALWVMAEVLNPHSAGLIPSLASFKTHLFMIPLYFFAAGLFRTPEDVRRFLIGLAVISLVPSAVSLLQYALGPASVLDLSPRYRQNIAHYHEWRPFGTSAVPGGSSVFAFLTVPLMIVLLMSPGDRPRVRTLAVLSIALSAGVFVVSGVRQVFLGCLVALVVMAALLLSRGRGRGVLALVFVLMLGSGTYLAVQTFLRPIATESLQRDRNIPDIWREQSVTDRLLTLAETGTYAEARGNPLGGILLRIRRYPFGAGLGRTGSAAGTLGAQLTADPTSSRIQNEVGFSDNFFADMVVEVGVPGMLMLTLILLGLLGGAIRLARHARDPLVMSGAAAIAGVLFALVAMSWGSQPLLGNPITAFFWFLGGLLASLRLLEVSDTAAGPVEPEVAQRVA